MPTYNQFFDALAQKETGGYPYPTNYSVMNSLGYIGKYQISLIVATVIMYVMASSTAIAQQESFANKSDCTKGSVLNQYLCFDEELNLLEKNLVETLKKNIADTQSEWGKDAVEEIKNRMLLTQDFWIKYRDNQCHQNYYSKAPIHPPSQSLLITMCKIYKTKDRIQELNENSANYNLKKQ